MIIEYGDYNIYCISTKSFATLGYLIPIEEEVQEIYRDLNQQKAIEIQRALVQQSRIGRSQVDIIQGEVDGEGVPPIQEIDCLLNIYVEEDGPEARRVLLNSLQEVINAGRRTEAALNEIFGDATSGDVSSSDSDSDNSNIAFR